MLDWLDKFSWLGYALTSLLVAGYLLLGGYFQFKRKQINLSAKDESKLQEQLNSWQIDELASSQTIRDVFKRLSTLVAFAELGAGMGMTLVTIIIAGVGLTVSTSPNLSYTGHAWQ